MDLPSLLRFTSLIHALMKVERKLFATGTDREETDIEHSYQLALTAWYLNGRHALGLDTDKVFKYALAHDLVETYAGDTPAYNSDEAFKASKHIREAEAAARLKEEHPEFPELHSIIAGYEARADREARFVYALDKLLPMMNIYLDNGRSWRRDGVKLQMIREYKKDKVVLSPEIREYYEALLAAVRGRETELFGTEAEG